MSESGSEAGLETLLQDATEAFGRLDDAETGDGEPAADAESRPAPADD